MLTFSDLIKNNVAPTPYEMDVVTTTGLDRLIINYNNIWGCISDTHMSKGEDGNYYITGQLFSDPVLTDEFIASRFWGDYCFKDSSVGAATLEEYLAMFGYTAVRMKRNGDDVICLVQLEKKEE